MKHFCGSENGRLVTVFWFTNSEQLEYPAWKANTKIAVFIIFPRADKVYPPWYSPILTAPAIKRMSVKPIPRDPGAVGLEEKARRKFQTRAEKPLGTDSYRSISKRSSESWLFTGHKNALYYCAQSANSITWILFVCSYKTALSRRSILYLSGSFAKVVHTRETLIFYFTNQ